MTYAWNVKGLEEVEKIDKVNVRWIVDQDH